jgi:hypothetical protein
MIDTHHIKVFHSDTCQRSGLAPVSLKRVPGVTITSDRPETAPTLPTIRTATPRRNPTGIALQAAATRRRVEMLKQAMHEVAEGGV